MESQAYINLIDFIGELPRPEKKVHKKDLPVLGKTFTGNAEIMKIISVLSGKHTNDKGGDKPELDLKKNSTRFNVFILLVHRYYNDHLRKKSSEFESKINTLATALHVNAGDKQQVVDFFFNDEPYSDKTDAVYFNNNKKTNSVKYIGTNVMYAGNRADEIVYLKYFKNYEVFLSKTFVKSKHPHHFMEEIAITDLNVLYAANYYMDDYGYNTFEEIVESVKNHKPFQYFELAATANTPKIVLDPAQGKIIIGGSSSPFSPTNFFTPILEWLESYKVLGKEPLKIFIMLDYFNTYTSKFLLRLCRQCDTMAKEGKQIRIYWYFDPEDTDMREFGEHLGGIYKKGFEYCLITDGQEELV